jgi:hypothetical protein
LRNAKKAYGDYVHLAGMEKGERKKEGRIKCKHTSFTPCVCASNGNVHISFEAWCKL